MKSEPIVLRLQNGFTTLIDAEDYDRISKYSWYARQDGNVWYVQCNYTNQLGKRTTFRLHREILNAPQGISVDHIDGNGLNNVKENLRLCTHAENHGNRRVQVNNTTGYKGVTFNKKYNKWKSRIHYRGKRYELGEFRSAEEAALAYNSKAIELFGNFARLNIIGEKIEFPKEEME